jgi:hypothetical protein
MTCPKCGKDVRIHVKLFLDILASMYANLSKKALRSADVHILGAGWDDITLVCTNESCNFIYFDKH